MFDHFGIVCLVLLRLVAPAFGQIQPASPPLPATADLNATNGTLAVGGPAAAANATADSSGPLARLGQFAQSLSPFPLNNSAPAPSNAASSNATNTSPLAVNAEGGTTNATGAFTPYNATMAPLVAPPTASTFAPPEVPVVLPAGNDADGGFALATGNSAMNGTNMTAAATLSNTTTSSTTSPPPPPPPQPASAHAAVPIAWSLAVGSMALALMMAAMT